MLSHGSRCWVNPENRVGLRVDEVVRDEMAMAANEDDPVKVVQNKKPGEEESRVPEWIRDPGVQVVIIPRRRVVGDDRRTFLIVIVVYYRWVRFGLVFGNLAGITRHNRQTEFSSDVLKRPQGFILPHWQFLSIRCSSQGTL